MFVARLIRNSSFLFFPALLLLGALPILLISPRGISGEEKKSPDPWPVSQTVQAADFARELTDKSSSLPTVVYVGFHALFAGGHIPGASFHGSGSSEQGLSELKKWAETLPRTTDLVIYCGCCPLEKCPNIRPAFTALRDLGFKKLRVLVLPTSFATDWVDKGYPTQKGT